MKTRTITHYESGWSSERPDNLTEYIAWLEAKLAEIPEQYRASANVEIEACPSYEGSVVLEYRITYTRPETDQERECREGAEVLQNAQREAQERAELKRLRAKYGQA